VRALGGSTGQSDWSDPGSHMANLDAGSADILSASPLSTGCGSGVVSR